MIDGEQFNNSLIAVLEASSPLPKHHEQVARGLDALRLVVTRRLGETWRVDAFGSMANGFSTLQSDLDVVAYDSRLPFEVVDPVTILKQLRNAVQRTGFFEVKCIIYGARVPILKLLYEESLEIDLSVNNTTPLLNTRLLKAYASMNERVAQLGVAVKLWAQDHRLCGAFRGHLSSYAFLLMVLYFLQVAGPDKVACLQDSGRNDSYFEDHDLWKTAVAQLVPPDWCLKSSVAELLCSFFLFYAEVFRWGIEVVSVRLGQRHASSFEGFTELSARDTHRLHIEDPFERSRNLNDVLSTCNEQDLRAALQESHRAASESRRIELLPPVPAPEAGDLVLARRHHKADIAGYLELSPGDQVEVLYIGAVRDSREKGWLYGRCFRAQEKKEGWLARSAVTVQKMIDVVSSRTLGSARVLVSVSAAGGGHVDVNEGEDVNIQYVGSESEGDAGWLYGKTASGCGWFPAQVAELRKPCTGQASDGGA